MGTLTVQLLKTDIGQTINVAFRSAAGCPNKPGALLRLLVVSKVRKKTTLHSELIVHLYILHDSVLTVCVSTFAKQFEKAS